MRRERRKARRVRPERTPAINKPLSDEKGSLIGWLNISDRGVLILTRNHEVSNPEVVPDDFCVGVTVARQTFKNKRHAKRVSAAQGLLEEYRDKVEGA